MPIVFSEQEEEDTKAARILFRQQNLEKVLSTVVVTHRLKTETLEISYLESRAQHSTHVNDPWQRGWHRFARKHRG
jgi:hypothetical protein